VAKRSTPPKPPTRAALRPLVGDLAQFAGVRRIALDDGQERGVRALAFTTGGGLDFWVMADRALDIGTVSWRGMPMAWQGVNGFRAPAFHDPEIEGGRGFARSFSGFLVTCGLNHTRQPADGQPLHGYFPFTPATLMAYGADWEREEPVLYCEGEVVQGRLHGEVLRLHRRIEAPIGGGLIRIRDRVTNDTALPSKQALLYHINIGYPFLRDGAEVRMAGKRIGGPFRLPDPAGTNGAVCHPAPKARMAEATLASPGVAAKLTVAFDTRTLPFLQVWSDPRPNAHVVGIEPCTSDRLPSALSAEEPVLAPGEVRNYQVDIRLDA
jgi:hypothetical protein